MKLKINKYSEYKKLKLIILIAIILRVTFFIIAQPWNTDIEQNRIIRSDAIGYHELAISILNDFTFELNGQKNSFRTPGYPVFLAIIYSIFGVKPYIVLIFQIIINIFSILIVYQISKNLFNKEIALISSFLFSIDPHTILYTCELFTETLFTFIVLLAFMYFIKALQSKKMKYFALTGLLFGISTLIRPITQLIPFFIIGVILIYSKFDLKIKVKSSIIIVFSFLLTISPWIYRNHINFSNSSLSSLPAYNLIFYNVAYTEFSKSEKKINDFRRELSKTAKEKGAKFSHWTTNNAKSFANSDIYNEISKNYIKNNFLLFSYIHVKNSVLVFLNVGTKGIMSMLRFKEIELPNMAATGLMGNIINIIKLKTPFEIALIIFIAIFFLSIYLLTIIGIISLSQQKEFFLLILFMSFIIYFSFTLGANGNAARFKLPIIPFYTIIASVGFVRLKKTF